MRKAKITGSDPWLSLLDHRNTPTAGMQTSPAQRLMSSRTRTLLPTTANLLKPQIPVDVLQELATRQANQAHYYNKTAKDLPRLQPGQAVHIQPLNAYDHKWKPATVQRQINIRSYDVTTEDGQLLHRNRKHLRAAPATTKPKQQTAQITTSQQSRLTPATISKHTETTNVARSKRVVKKPAYLKNYVV